MLTLFCLCLLAAIVFFLLFLTSTVWEGEEHDSFDQ
jgi:hypothetical protein